MSQINGHAGVSSHYERCIYRINEELKLDKKRFMADLFGDRIETAKYRHRTQRISQEIHYTRRYHCAKYNGAFEPSDYAINKVLSTLKPGEAYVIRQRYSESNPTLEEIGRYYPSLDGGMGVTRERIRQILLTALKRLRHPSRQKSLLPQDFPK